MTIVRADPCDYSGAIIAGLSEEVFIFRVENDEPQECSGLPIDGGYSTWGRLGGLEGQFGGRSSSGVDCSRRGLIEHPFVIVVGMPGAPIISSFADGLGSQPLSIRRDV